MPPRLLPLLVAALLVPSLVTAQARSLSVGGVELRYEVTGQGPVVVLLHGWALDRRSWDFLVPALDPRFTVVSLDRRGFGESGSSADLSLEPGDVAAILDDLRVERAVVVGHSQGAASALRFALDRPERVEALVLYGSGPPAGFGLPWNGPDAFPPIARIAREQGLDAMKALFQDHPIMAGSVPGTAGDSLLNVIFGDYDGRDLLDPVPSADATPAPHMDDLAQVEAPTLVVTGELEMPYFQIVSDALAYGIRGAERARVPGGGHAVHLQQPEAFNALLLEFIERRR